MFYHSYESSIGKIYLFSDGIYLTGLYFENQVHLSFNDEYRDLEIFSETKRWLDIYFKGDIPNFTPALYYEGTPFQHDIYNILLSIPYGKTMTYKEIANSIAQRRGMKTMSAQAVGGAVGKNPISIIIPCHRVIGSNHSLVGYAGGLDKKRELLRIENINIKEREK